MRRQWEIGDQMQHCALPMACETLTTVDAHDGAANTFLLVAGTKARHPPGPRLQGQ